MKVFDFVDTDFSYFGARYYDAGLSIWLSVDPMAHKFPYQSSYTYCGWNPVGIIDPNGKEEYELDKKTGKISQTGEGKFYRDQSGNVSSQKTDDASILVDKLTDSKGRVTYVTAGVLSSSTTYTNKNKSSGKIDFVAEIFSFRNSDEANDFYMFVAKGSDVEWGFGKVKDTHGGGGFVGTGREPGHSPISAILEQVFGNGLQLLSHSHPTGGQPSMDIYNSKTKRYVGDLNSAASSTLDVERQVYDVPNSLIYSYDKSTYSRAKNGGAKYNDQPKRVR